eukprot:15564745-Heterocapsa_arctica.AAC.1
MLENRKDLQLLQDRLLDRRHDRDGEEHELGADATSFRILPSEPKETKWVFPATNWAGPATVRIARRADDDQVVEALFDAGEVEQLAIRIEKIVVVLVPQDVHL